MKSLYFLTCLCASLTLVACTPEAPSPETTQTDEQSYTFTDALGYDVTVDYGLDRVVSLYGSYTEVADLAGATLVGVTDDVKDRYTLSSENLQVVGSYKAPNVEAIIALQPDFVILNPNMSEQVELHDTLTSANIPTAFFEVEHFDDYLNLLDVLTTLTQNESAYTTYGEDVAKDIDAILSQNVVADNPKILLLRAYSTNVKARDTENATGRMIDEFNTTNLTELYPSLLEELSAEVIVKEDPEYIFVTTMGSNTDAAMEQLNEMILNNPAYASLTAVKEERVYILPQDLFHYKPNQRWAEAYAYLSDLFAQN